MQDKTKAELSDIYRASQPGREGPEALAAMAELARRRFYQESGKNG